MSTHLTDKEIDKYVSGFASVKDIKKAAEHIESCQKCRYVSDALQSVIAVQSPGPVPGEHVRKKILEEWHRIHNTAVIKNEERKPVLSRLTAGFAVASIIVVMISWYLFSNRVITWGSYPLALNSAVGEVYLNDSVAVKNTRLRTGDVMSTSNNASASVSLDGYILFLGKSSSLQVVCNNKGEELRFKLVQGAVISKSSGQLKYSFECGNYKVMPVGTGFMLHYSNKKLDAAVSQGKIFVSDLKSGIEIPAGMKWSSDNPQIIKPIDEKTSALLNSDFSSGLLIENNNVNSKNINSDMKNNGSELKDKNDSLNNESSPDEDVKAEQEKLRIKRELRNDLNEMKREQRREKKGLGSD